VKAPRTDGPALSLPPSKATAHSARPTRLQPGVCNSASAGRCAVRGGASGAASVCAPVASGVARARTSQHSPSTSPPPIHPDPSTTPTTTSPSPPPRPVSPGHHPAPYHPASTSARHLHHHARRPSTRTTRPTLSGRSSAPRRCAGTPTTLRHRGASCTGRALGDNTFDGADEGSRVRCCQQLTRSGSITAG